MAEVQKELTVAEFQEQMRSLAGRSLGIEDAKVLAYINKTATPPKQSEPSDVVNYDRTISLRVVSVDWRDFVACCHENGYKPSDMVRTLCYQYVIHTITNHAKNPLAPHPEL